MNSPVGIDLGTTYSAVAAMNDAGRVDVLKNREGGSTTPSVVLFDPDEPEPLVGEEAKSLARAMPDRFVEAVKRQMGHPAEWEFDGRVYTPVDISAIILGKLRCDAEAALGRPVREAVVTVPAYFANSEREDTRQAACAAGLDVLQIINEPTAAAIAFKMERPTEQQTVLVYDLGGGTFDVTLLSVDASGIDVLTSKGDVKLGGKDWDRALFNHVRAAFMSEHDGIDPKRDHDANQALTAACEAAKISLTERNQVAIPCRCDGNVLQVTVTRDAFQDLTEDLLERTRSTVHEVLDRTSKSAGDIDRVLLVGGSTRMPMVRSMLSEMFPDRTDTTIHPDECVAIGAALQAARVSIPALPGGPPPALPAAARGLMSMSISDVTAHSLGTVAVTDDGSLATSFIIPKDAKIPAEQRKNYKTTKPNQESWIVPVVQGESANPRINQLLDCYEFTGIPPRPAGESHLEVSFRYNASGIVEVEATDTKSGTALERHTLHLDSLDDLAGGQAEPLSVVLLLDVSGSMSGEPLVHAKQGARGFIEQFLAGEVYLPPGVRIGVVAFGSDVTTVMPFDEDPRDGLAAIDAISISGSTNMSDAIRTAHSMLASEPGRRVTLLLTDGAPDNRNATRGAAASARNDGIVLGALSCPGADEDFLAEICTPGVDIRSVTDTSELEQAFGNLASELSSGAYLSGT